ncbi:hypothetical protein UB51_22595 [Paenibacillus sp. IHBB 10380]|nr:hypothetical protein UB51_22595 [Paenibacillus sp. IHBB 10380]
MAFIVHLKVTVVYNNNVVKITKLLLKTNWDYFNRGCMVLQTFKAKYTGKTPPFFSKMGGVFPVSRHYSDDKNLIIYFMKI